MTPIPSSAAGEPFTTVDTAWLRMDTPTNLMMVNGFFDLTGRLDMERLRHNLETRLLPFPRFRQLAVEQSLFRQPRWEYDPEFDLDNHIEVISLPRRGAERAFRGLLDDLAATPLDRRKPLWRATVVTGYRGGTAIIWNMHHAVGDGIAMMRVLLSVCDTFPNPPATRAAGEARSTGSQSIASYLRPAARTIAGARKYTSRLMHSGIDVLRSPASILEYTDTGTAYAKALAHLTVMPPDPPTLLKGELGPRKRTTWADRIRLVDVKHVAKATDSTVNDVLISAVAGGLGRYLRMRGEDIDEVHIRAMVPVNVRSTEVSPGLGNEFGLVLPKLEVGYHDPVERLRAVKHEMDAIKESPQAAVSFAILQTIGSTASDVQRLIVNFFGTKTSLVMTNVPGPEVRLYLAGMTLRRMMFWVPQSAGLGLGVSIFSYAGEIDIGVMSDEQMIPDPDGVVAFFLDEFAELAVASGLSAEVDDGVVPRRCRALTRDGRRCRRRAHPEFRCSTHR
jgi:WS/DGAT/MGAT family acyltransferase